MAEGDDPVVGPGGQPDLRRRPVRLADDRGRRRARPLVRGSQAFGERALSIGEEAVAETAALLGVTEDEPIDFFIYADEDAFYDALGPGTRENVGGPGERGHPDAVRAHRAVRDRRPVGRRGRPARARPPRVRHGRREPVPLPAALAQRGPGDVPERGLRRRATAGTSRPRPRRQHHPARRAWAASSRRRPRASSWRTPRASAPSTSSSGPTARTLLRAHRRRTPTAAPTTRRSRRRSARTSPRSTRPGWPTSARSVPVRQRSAAAPRRPAARRLGRHRCASSRRHRRPAPSGAGGRRRSRRRPHPGEATSESVGTRGARGGRAASVLAVRSGPWSPRDAVVGRSAHAVSVLARVSGHPDLAIDPRARPPGPRLPRRGAARLRRARASATRPRSARRWSRPPASCRPSRTSSSRRSSTCASQIQTDGRARGRAAPHVVRELNDRLEEARIAAGPHPADRDRHRPPARGLARPGRAGCERGRLPGRCRGTCARSSMSSGRPAPRPSRSTASASCRRRRSSTSVRRSSSTRPTSCRRTRSRPLGRATCTAAWRPRPASSTSSAPVPRATASASQFAEPETRRRAGLRRDGHAALRAPGPDGLGIGATAVVPGG